MRTKSRSNTGFPVIGRDRSIPIDGGTKTFFPRDGRGPAESVEFRGVDMVAAIVKLAVFDKSDVATVRVVFTEEIDEFGGDVNVGDVKVGTDVIDRAVGTFVENSDKGFGDIFHIEERTGIDAAAVDATGLIAHQQIDKFGD